MLQINVNGGHFNLHVVDEQEEAVLNLIRTNPDNVHTLMCAELRIGAFMPAPHRIQFALMRTQLEIMGEGKLLASFGGDLVCYQCQVNLSDKPAGLVSCPQCGAVKLKNFKPINLRVPKQRPKFTNSFKSWHS